MSRFVGLESFSTFSFLFSDLDSGIVSTQRIQTATAPLIWIHIFIVRWIFWIAAAVNSTKRGSSRARPTAAAHANIYPHRDIYRSASSLLLHGKICMSVHGANAAARIEESDLERQIWGFATSCRGHFAITPGQGRNSW